MDETGAFFLLFAASSTVGILLVREIWKMWERHFPEKPPRVAFLALSWLCGIVALQSSCGIILGMIVTIVGAFIAERSCSFRLKQFEKKNPQKPSYQNAKVPPGLPTTQELARAVSKKKTQRKPAKEKVTSLQGFQDKHIATRLKKDPDS